MHLELHKHPVWVTVGILSGMTFLFNAGFIYSTINHDWIELKGDRQKIRQLEENDKIKTEQIKHLTEQNETIISHIKLRDNHINSQLKHINNRLDR